MHVVPDIRLATAQDAADIAAMSRDFIEQGLGWSWTAARVLRSIRDRSTNVAVARTGQLEAFGIMNYGDDAAHLSLLAVHPASRRKGLATQLVAWLELSARVAGMERIRLEARSDNPQALAFYLQCGFSQVASVQGYYQGQIDALRFEKVLRLPGE
jgi:ribosomal protein S18 acetylase RimI-like enzyme